MRKKSVRYIPLKLPYKEGVARDAFYPTMLTGQRFSDIKSLNEGIVKKKPAAEKY